jgi:hypothetical protein
MARLASKQKMGYYPLPQTIAETIKTNLTFEKGASAIDLFAGCGTAIKTIAGAQAALYGNELNTERFELMKPLMDFATNGAAEFIEIEGDVSLHYFNPPYDVLTDGRSEAIFLEATTQYLMPQGVFIGIVPEVVLTHYNFANELFSWYTAVNVRRFPEPEFSVFHQVVVFATKREHKVQSAFINTQNVMMTARKGFPVLRKSEFAYTVQKGQITSFKVSAPTLAASLQEIEETGGVHSTKLWKANTIPTSENLNFTPLMKPKPGHAAMMLAAGMLDGARVGDSIIKGYHYKYIETVDKVTPNDDGTNTRETIETERFANAIVTLNIKTGDIHRIDSKENPSEYEAYINANLDFLLEQVHLRYKPLYNGDYSRFAKIFEHIHAPGVLAGHKANGLLEPQKHVVAAIATGFLSGQKGLFLEGDMGVGKTMIAIATMILVAQYTNLKRVIVLCPPHLVAKWRREAERAGRDYKVKGFICRSILDVDDAFAYDGISFLILGHQDAKNHSIWEPASRKKHVRKTETVTTYEVSYYGSKTPVEKEINHVVNADTCPNCGAPVNSEIDIFAKKGAQTYENQYNCVSCGSALWSMVPFVKGPRVALAYYINRKYSGFGFINDECFPGNTPVLTPDGEKAIRDIRPGDLVLSSKGPRKVTRLVVKPMAGNLITVKYSGGAFTCTPNHKIYTQRGLVRADALQRGDSLYGPKAMPDLSGVVRDTTIHQALADHMQYQVRNGETETGWQLGSEEQGTALSPKDMPGLPSGVPAQERQTGLLLATLFREHEWARTKSAQKSGVPGEVVSQDESRQSFMEARCHGSGGPKAKGSNSGLQTREWTLDAASADALGSSRFSVAARISNQDGHPFLEIRQAGYSESEIEDRYRSGWSLTQDAQAESDRPEEGRDLVEYRVEAVEVHKRGSDEQPGNGFTQDQLVYNLEVEDAHNYFACGVLVSNCHETKGGDTNIGYATRWLSSASRYTIQMTGTIYNGFASGLFHMAHRGLKSFRDIYTYDDVNRFVDHHGLRQKITKEKSRYAWSSTYGYSRNASVRNEEIPGATPGIVAVLLPYTAFLHIEDISDDLPPYKETQLAIEPSKESYAWKDYDKLIEGTLFDEAKAAAQRGNMGLFSMYLQASLGHLDCAEHGDRFEHKEIGVIEVQPAQDAVEKDAAIIDLIQKENSNGNRVLLYIMQANRRDPMPRLGVKLNLLGIKYAILRKGEEDSVLPDGTKMKVDGFLREEFVNTAVAKGATVMMCSPELVKTGLDLIQFPRIVFFAPHYSIFLLRQASRRSWRLGQTKPVEVIYAYWKGTRQQDALAHVAKKMRAATLIDGRAISGLGSMGAEKSFLQDLVARAIGAEEPSLPEYVPPEKGNVVIEPEKKEIKKEEAVSKRKVIAATRQTYKAWIQSRHPRPVEKPIVAPAWISTPKLVSGVQLSFSLD